MKITAEKVAAMSQFLQTVRRAMEPRLNGVSLLLLELDMGISGSQRELIIPGSQRFFIKGTATHPLSKKMHPFRVDFAMRLGDTREADVAELVNDVVVKITKGFYGE